MKELLKEAYDAGLKSVSENKDRDNRLERGVKQIEKEYTFENWYFNKELAMHKSNKKSFEESSNIANDIINGYSELEKLNKTQIGSAQLFHAMESFNNEMNKQ